MAKNKQMVKWLLAIGMLLAVGSGFITGMDALVWGSVLVGVIAGFFLSADVKTFLSLMVLTTAATGLAVIPAVGGLAATVFGKIAAFFGAVAILPATRVLVKKAGISW